MKSVKLVIFLHLVALVFVAGYGQQPPAALRVVSLHTVLTEIAREIGGAQVQVTGLVRPGADPHLFEPSPADMRRLGEADLVLAGGLGLETYLPRLAAEIAPGRLIEVGARLSDPLKGLSAHRSDESPVSDEYDPHWWQGIGQVLVAVSIVEQEMSRCRPAFATEYAGNATAYRARLTALQAWADAEVNQLPAARRQLVTTHDAFGYFAREHGFTVHPLLGLSTADDANAKHVASIIDLIRLHHIKAVFAEGSSNPRLIEAIVRETPAKLGGSLYADGLGVTEATTYEAMIRHNITAIVAALR
ncbi:MAG: hypothetical protein EXS41_03360 [Opitutaceae bacterium]|nr:hypothetical protein [Opitutaceae bacterium]